MNDGNDLTDPASLAARFRQALMPLVRQLRTQVEPGMTPSLMSALGTVAREGPITLGELAGREKVTAPMVTKLADGLEERELVRRVGCPDDKRVVRLELTAAGRALLDRAASRRNAWLAERLAALSERDRTQVAAVVDVIERLNQADEASP